MRTKGFRAALAAMVAPLAVQLAKSRSTLAAVAFEVSMRTHVGPTAQLALAARPSVLAESVACGAMAAFTSQPAVLAEVLRVAHATSNPPNVVLTEG